AQETDAGEDEGATERDEHLALLVAGELAKNEPLHHDAEQADAEPADDRRQPEMQLDLQQRVAEIGAEHEERAVRQIWDPHQAENQREARRQQEQQAAEGHAIQRLDDPELPLHRWSAPDGSSMCGELRYAPSPIGRGMG